MLFRKISAAIVILVIATVATNDSTVLATSINDMAITTEVKARLASEKDIPKNIEVITKNGIVSFKGKVDTSLQAHKAIEVASSVDNVIDVVDTELKVKESKSIMTDAIITAKVKGKIRHLYVNQKIVEDYDLQVETTNKIVHIFGNVARAIDVDTIVSATKEVKGVKSVKTSISYPAA